MVSSGKSGFAISGAIHVAILAAILFGFADAPKPVDAQEAVPIELVTTSEFNQVTKGIKTAKEVKPQQKVEKVAELTETKPQPMLNEAKRDVATPPPPLKRQEDPGQDDKLDPAKAAVMPPPRPPEPKPEEKKAEAKSAPTPPERPKPPEPDKDAEAIERKPDPMPVPRPKEPPKREAQATPDPKPRPDPPKKPEVKPEPPKEFKPDQVAKLLQDKQKDPPKPAAKPKSGDETQEQHRKFDASDISKLLSKETAQRRASTGRELQQVASLGTPSASAPKMSPSMMAQIDGYLLDRYRECWAYTPLGTAPAYVAQIRIHYTSDGTLAADPQLVNPTGDSNQRIVAEAAMRAVKRCNPLHMPAQYQAYYDYWKSRVIGFNPNEM